MSPLNDKKVGLLTAFHLRKHFAGAFDQSDEAAELSIVWSYTGNLVIVPWPRDSRTGNGNG